MPKLKLENRNINMYYEIHGRGKPIVLINGLISDHTGWMPILDALAKEYQVLIFDNRGAGQTVDTGEAFTIETMADDTMALIEALKLEKPYIIGHSLGGAVAQEISRKYSERINKIALCNTFMELNEAAKTGFSEVLTLHEQKATQPEIMNCIIPWVFDKDFINPELIALIHQASNDNPYPQSQQNYYRQYQALINFNSSKWANSINIPTLVVGSQNDLTATAEEAKQLAENIPQAELKILPGGHASAVEQPILLTSFLISYERENSEII